MAQAVSQQRRTHEEAGGGRCHQSAADCLGSAAHRILASIAARIGQGDARFAAEALAAMATCGLGRQEYLDSIIAHLLTLLRSSPASFTPRVLAQIAGALGRMQEGGGADGCSLSVRSGVSADHRAANARFLSTFNARILASLPEFLESDLGSLHEHYFAWHVGEDVFLRFLHRAGQLQLGLLPGTVQHLGMMQRTLESTRCRFPGFFATMPEFPRRYCERLSCAE
uniref:Uncharacterized protein n=1 Tax=Alexandrium andersonii TaxID=327968 RepID=A0A7S2D8D5_9DINO